MRPIALAALLPLLVACVETSGRRKSVDAADPVSTTFHISATTMPSAGTTSLSAGYGVPAPEACDHLVTSTCEGFVCPDGTTADAGARSQPQQAGIVHLVVEGSELTLEPSADGTYKTKKSSALWTGGERVEVSADGGDIPAFNDALEAPGRLALASPLPSAGQSLGVDRGANLEIRWTGTSDGSFFLGLMALTGRALVQCRFTAGTGHGAVPSSLLGDLPEGGYLMMAGSVMSSTSKVGGYTVETDLATQSDIAGAAAAPVTLH